MILAIDTSTAACTAALFDGGGDCIARADEVIGRGHAERLVPMIAELLDGRRADSILVGVGPGSFTGIRVGIAAARGMAIGWGVEAKGMASLALLAVGADADGAIAAALEGGHGELFVQQFNAALAPQTPLLNLSPEAAAAEISSDLVIGPGAARLVEARGWGTALDALPAAADALRLPALHRQLGPKPVYARAPDARVRSAA